MTDREAALEAKLEAAQMENRLLREKIDALVRALYGKKSERLDPAQLELLGGLAEKIPEAPAAVEPPAGVAKKAPSKPRRPGPRVPEHLPVKEVVLDPDEVLACPQEWRLMGEEVSEQLDYEPGRFYRRCLIRRKYVRKDAPFSAPVIAPLPPCMQERCLATPELIAHVVISKYADHLPLYRQSQIYRRAGVELSRQTLCRWVDLAADTCQLLYEWMVREQMAHAYLQIDETSIPYLDPGWGQTAKGYLWVCSLPNGYVIYIWHPSRSAECLQQILPEHYRGIIQCDGYAAYPSVARQRAGPDLELEQGPVQLASCWAHTRRKFFEAREHAPSVAGWILSARSPNSTGSKPACASAGPDRACAPPCAPPNRPLSSHASEKPLSSCASATAPSAPWPRPSTTLWLNGPAWSSSSKTGSSSSTTTRSSELSAPPRSAPKTGCF